MKTSKTKKRRKIAKALLRLSLLIVVSIFLIWGMWSGASCLIDRNRKTEFVNLFFFDDITGTLTPISREINRDNIPENIIRALIDGSKKNDNTLSTLNPDTRLRSIKIENKIATVDVSSEIRKLTNPLILEKESAYSIINTLLLLPEIDGVQFLIDGVKPAVLSETFDISGIFTELLDSKPATTKYFLYFPEKRNRYISTELTEIKEIADTKIQAEFLIRRYVQGTNNLKLSSPLNPNTKILGVTLNQSQLTVDFSREILNSNLSSEGETSFLKTLTWTLTELPGIKSVKIIIEGSPVVSLFGHHSYRDPFTRWDKSRLVNVDGSEIPVLVYFAVKTDDGEYTLVPRLRFIPVAGEILPQMLDALLAGPNAVESENTLTTCIPEGTTGNVSIEGDTIKLNLTGCNLTDIENKAFETTFLQQLLMTLTETRRDSGLVNITIDDMIQESLPYGTIISGNLTRSP